MDEFEEMDQSGAFQANRAQSSTRITSNMQVNVDSNERNLYSDDEEEEDDQIDNGDFKIDKKVIEKFHNDIDNEDFF